MQMTHVDTETLIPAAAYAATILSCAQKPATGLRFDENHAPAGRRYR
jgi:hypothetical protein